MSNQITVKNEVFWKAGLSISCDGKYPEQHCIEEHFNFKVLVCWGDSCTLQFNHDADSTLFALRWC